MNKIVHMYQLDHSGTQSLEEGNKLGCTSVKLLVWLKFTKALSDFITKKDMKFFFQFEKGKYEPIFRIIIIFK